MREPLKQILNIIACILVLPAYCFWRLGSTLLGGREALQGPAQLLALMPGRVGVYLRRAFYKLVLKECGANTCFSFGVIISDPEAQFARGVYVGPYSILGRVEVGENAVIASQVSLLSGLKQHQAGQPSKEGSFESISIGRETWIGERVVVGASIGSFSVVGAGSVVVKEVEDKVVVAGNPAKVIRRLD